MDSTIIILSILFIFLIGILVALRSRYISCPPGKMMVIYGNVKKPNEYGMELTFGGSKFIYPFIQHYGFIDLSPYKLDYTQDLYSKDEVIVKTVMAITYAVSTKPNIYNIVALKLQDMLKKDVEILINSILYSEIPTLFRTLNISDISKIKKNGQLQSKIERTINTELNKMGIELLSINLISIDHPE